MFLLILLILLAMAFAGGFAAHVFWVLAIVLLVCVVVGLLSGQRF